MASAAVTHSVAHKLSRSRYLVPMQDPLQRSERIFLWAVALHTVEVLCVAVYDIVSLAKLELSDADKHFEVYWALLTGLQCFFGISFAYAAVRYENVRCSISEQMPARTRAESVVSTGLRASGVFGGLGSRHWP